MEGLVLHFSDDYITFDWAGCYLCGEQCVVTHRTMIGVTCLTRKQKAQREHGRPWLFSQIKHANGGRRRRNKIQIGAHWNLQANLQLRHYT